MSPTVPSGDTGPSPAIAGEDHGGADELDTALLSVYDALKTLLARDDLDPAVRASLIEALANVSLAVQDRVLVYEMLYDLGA